MRYLRKMLLRTFVFLFVMVLAFFAGNKKRISGTNTNGRQQELQITLSDDSAKTADVTKKFSKLASANFNIDAD